MKKKALTERAEKQYRQKLASLLGLVARVQIMADQAMELADMLEDDEESDTFRVLNNFSCVCEETLETVYNKLKDR